jgi:hypothetical protein
VPTDLPTPARLVDLVRSGKRVHYIAVDRHALADVLEQMRTAAGELQPGERFTLANGNEGFESTSTLGWLRFGSARSTRLHGRTCDVVVIAFAHPHPELLAYSHAAVNGVDGGEVVRW